MHTRCVCHVCTGVCSADVTHTQCVHDGGAGGVAGGVHDVCAHDVCATRQHTPAVHTLCVCHVCTTKSSANVTHTQCARGCARRCTRRPCTQCVCDGVHVHVRRAHRVCVTSALEGPLIMSHINRFWRRGRGGRRPRARTGRASRRHHRLQWFRHTQSGGAGRGGGVQV